ncbi:hypothetical protein DFJ73DRAFT_852626 [Zopfochytrium polystomum]|nr:hypothetical protein DFJ73DRAFT_852626 [Zopfochytrium polystomum]
MTRAFRDSFLLLLATVSLGSRVPFCSPQLKSSCEGYNQHVWRFANFHSQSALAIIWTTFAVAAVWSLCQLLPPRPDLL